MNKLPEMIGAFRGKKVLVIGDGILDLYLDGSTERLCREAPAPVLTLETRTASCGGAANTAVNLVALGATVSFLTVLGDDDHGRTLCQLLSRAGVDTRHVKLLPSRETVAKTRIGAAASILLRLDEGSTGPLDHHALSTFRGSLNSAIKYQDAIVLSDYDCGLLAGESVEMIERLARNRLVVVDARKPEKFRRLRPVAVKPNYQEAIAMLGLPKVRGERRVTQMIDASDELLEATGARSVYVTLDVDGVVLLEEGRPPFRLSSSPVKAVRTIGAGDSFTSALSLSLCSGADAQSAARIAAAAAAVALEKDGTSSCSAAELRAYLTGNAKWLVDEAQLSQAADTLRRAGKRIVFTNGCFDVLHRGHVDFLRQARALGDVLIVALNSDGSIRRIKGDDRPINTLSDRIEVLTGLTCVDFLVGFDADTADELVRCVRPDVYVKGSAHEHEHIPEARSVEMQGGEARIISAAGFSTSELIHRIRDGRSGNSTGNAYRLRHEQRH